MDALGGLSAEIVSEAIVLWTGRGRSGWPARDDKVLIQHYGDLGIELIPVVERLHSVFYESDAWCTAPELGEAGNIAATRFRELYPQISEEAVEALRWCYWHDYR
jgi:hypothetical protein